MIVYILLIVSLQKRLLLVLLNLAFDNGKAIESLLQLE
jgi:hypothetical protein